MEPTRLGDDDDLATVRQLPSVGTVVPNDDEGYILVPKYDLKTLRWVGFGVLIENVIVFVILILVLSGQ